MKLNKINNILYYFLGILFLFLGKIRYSLRGYTRPRIFPLREFKRAIEYDFGVVRQWLKFLAEYALGNSTLKGKTILELGPGADLGIGIITLMKGAKKYNALDVNDLIKSVPVQFYQELFSYIETIPNKEVSADFLRWQWELTQRGKNDKINYLCRRDFDISVFEGENIDLVFSQAAFEHFENVEETVSQLSKVVRPGAILLAEIDLKTHSRWIGDLDPLNIYRYSDSLYNYFKFSGSPNRLRPFEYEEILKKYGWINIQISPLGVLEPEYLSKIQKTLNLRFRNKINQMDYLSIVLAATKQ